MKAFRFRLFVLIVGVSSIGAVGYSVVGEWRGALAWIALIGCLLGVWLLTGRLADWVLSPLWRLFQNPAEEEVGKSFAEDPDLQTMPELLELMERFHYLASLSKKQTQELQESETQAEVALRTKADFVRNISHFLRTPTGTILGLSESLQAQECSTEQREAFQTIHTTAYDLSQGIAQLLILAEIDYGMIRFDNQWIDLKAFVEQITTDFLAAIQAKTGWLTLQWEDPLPEKVFFDPRYLQKPVQSF